MKAGFYLVFPVLLAALVGCSAGKTRLDCYDECKRKGLAFSGVISRNSRMDDTGQVENTEICRCSIENTIY